jgi:formylglycine-generating enzyme required for sulfatase activity
MYWAEADQHDTAHVPRHEVALATFRIGRFPVTNAEWACFMEAGGYDDERWWDTAAGRAWRSGEGTAEGARGNNRVWWRRLRDRPALLEEMIEQGRLLEEAAERWRRWVALDEKAFEAELAVKWPGGRQTEPMYWQDGRLNNPSQPVVGICWYEMRAYANWLAAQTGEAYRLPTEVEWEAAARGGAGRTYAWGDEYDASRGNVRETRLRRTTPVGVFVEGDTPEGVSDLTGNVVEWTSSAFGNWEEDPEGLDPSYRYPYDGSDGREDAETGPEIARVARGGSWDRDPEGARAAARDSVQPVVRDLDLGGRLGLSASPIL